jgi:hypothetical protein
MTSNVSWNFTTTQETTPPTVTSTSPVNNAQDVAVGTNISATFSEPMDPSTIDATTFQVTLNGSAVSGTVNYSGTTATFTPASDLEFNSTYAVTVTTGVQDLAGNNMTSNVSWNFTTAQETTPPEVISQNPADGATDVPVDIPSIEVTFSEPMNSSTITNTTFSITLNGSSVKGKISYSGEIASFNPDKNLEFGSTYTVTVTTGVQDLAGNNMTSNVSWNFTTAQETTPPTVTSTSPVNNAQDVTVGTNISATFSEPMDPSTIDATTFQVTLNGSAVSGTVNYADNTATFTPASDLEFNSTYAVTVTTGVQDLAGNNMSSNVNWNFTTEQETIPPEVISQNPADGATDVPVDISSIEVTFSEPMDPSTIDATTFQVTLNGSAVSGSINYADNTATFTPASNLEFNSTYAVTVTTGVEDLVGNNMAENVAWTFTTEQEQTPPQVLSTSPANNTADVPINSTIRVTFSEEMNSSTITTTTILVSQNGTPVPGSINYLDKIATFTPSSNLAYGSDYSATVTTGVEDLAGNHLIADFNWTFVTELSSSTIPLTGN